MEKMTIAQQLLAGSKNMDRMQKETNELISMVIGFAKCTSTVPDKEKYIFDSEAGTWVILIDIANNNDHRYLRDISVLAQGGKMHWGISSKGIVSDKQGITAVYNDLQTFVNGMMQIFPSIEKEWKYLTDAAQL